MRYKIKFQNLEEEIRFISSRNDLVVKSLNNLVKYQNKLSWQSTNREIFDINYSEIISSLNDLTAQTDKLIFMLKKKYNMFDEIYEEEMKNIAKDSLSIKAVKTEFNRYTRVNNRMEVEQYLEEMRQKDIEEAIAKAQALAITNASKYQEEYSYDRYKY